MLILAKKKYAVRHDHKPPLLQTVIFFRLQLYFMYCLHYTLSESGFCLYYLLGFERNYLFR